MLTPQPDEVSEMTLAQNNLYYSFAMSVQSLLIRELLTDHALKNVRYGHDWDIARDYRIVVLLRDLLS